MESEAFQKLVEKLDAISVRLNNYKETTPLSDVWMDNQDVCELLHISKRTLQHYRDSGKIPFSQVGAKIYYKAKDIDDFLQSHYLKPSA
jgi:excisionase family DNA binding protein